MERGIQEYLQVDLGSVHLIQAIQTQGRYDRGRGQEYVEEYTVEYWRLGFEDWKEYKRWDGKQVRMMGICLLGDWMWGLVILER